MGRLGQVNRVAGQNESFFKWVNRVAVQSGRRSSRVASQVKLTRIFQTSLFFFEIDAICQLFISSLTVIKFSLVILLPITTKHFIQIWCNNYSSFLKANLSIIIDLFKIGRENEGGK